MKKTHIVMLLLPALLIVMPCFCMGGLYVAFRVSPSLGGLLPVWGPHFPTNTYADYEGVTFASRDHGKTFRSIAISNSARLAGDYECEMGDLPRFNLGAAEDYRKQIETVSRCDTLAFGSDCQFGNVSLDYRDTGVEVFLRESYSDDPPEAVTLYFRGEPIDLPISAAAMKRRWGKPTKVYEK